MKNKIARRVLTIIFSVVFIVSTVLGTLPSLAAGSNKTDLVNAVEFTTAAASVSSGTKLKVPSGTANAIKGKVPVYKKYYFKGNLSEYSSSSPIANITDGDINTQARSAVSVFAEKNAAGTEANYYTDGTQAYVDLIYELDDVSEIQQITLVSAGNESTNNYYTTTAEYKVYVGDAQDALMSNANMVAHVNNRTNKKIVQNITVKDGKTLSGKYVGLRIIDPTITKSENATTNILTSASNNVYPRLNEFAVFTKVDYSSIARATYVSDSTIELPTYSQASKITNLVLNKAPAIYKNQGSGDVLTTANYTNIVDGNVSTTQDCSFMNFASASIDDKGTTDKSDDEVINQASYKEVWSQAYVFDTGKEDNVLDKLVYISAPTNAKLTAGHYMVYASNDPDNLFDIENFILDFKNTTKQRRQVITFDNVSARYVGIRILDPIADWSDVFKIDSSNKVGTYFARPRIAEIAIFGKEKKSVNLFNATSTEDFETDTTLGESNLILGKTATVNYYTNYGADVQKNLGFAQVRLTDGLFNDNARNASAVFAEYESGVSKYIGQGITEGKYYLDIIYNLGSLSEVTGFELFSGSNNDLKTYHYQVYLSENESDLFSEDNIVTDFYNTDKKKHNKFKNTDANKTYKAQYVGFRILDPTCSKGVGAALAHNTDGNNYIYPRIQEITVYGKEQSIIDAPKTFDDKKEFITHTDENLAKNAKDVYLQYFSGTGTPKKSTEKIGNINDEDITTSTYNSALPMATYNSETGESNYIGYGITEGSMYTDVIFDFGVEASLSAMTLFHYVSSSGDKTFVTDHYQVFFSNKKDELFNGTPFIDVDGNNSIRNVLNLNLLNGNQNVVARYVGIRVLDPTTKHGEGSAVANHTDGKNYVYMRMNEISIYGTLLGVPEGYGTYLDSRKELFPSWGTNMLKGLTPVIHSNIKGVRKTAGAIDIANITDEKVGTQTRVSGVYFAEMLADGSILDYSSNGDGSVFVDLVFDMYSEVDISGIALFNYSANFANTHYILSVANKKTDLFKDNSWQMEVNNPEGNTRNAWNFDMMQYPTDVKGRYVAVRVLSPTQPVGSNPQTVITEKANNIYIRLQEIAVYGSYTDKDFVYVPKFTPLYMNQTTNDLLTKYGTNILAYKFPVETKKNGTNTGHANEKSIRVTDCDFGTQIDFGSTDGDKTEDTVFDMVWDLSAEGYYNITDFIYRGSNSDADYVTGWYKVYMSDDYDMLFEDENCVFEYNVMDENSEDVVVGGQIVNFKKSVYGCYIALRIISPVNTAEKSIYPRIREFAVFGTKADIDRTPVNFANVMPVEAYLGKTSGNLETVTDQNFTAKEVAALTDVNPSTTASVETEGKDLHLIYNLCQDADIYSIYTVGKVAKDVKNYKVYASSTLAGVWDDSALIYSYKNNNKIRTGKTFLEAYNMRYVRFEFIDTEDTVTLADIEIMGAKTYALRNKNLLKPLKSEQISVYKQNLKTNESKFDATVSTDKLHNGFLNDAIGFTCGLEGKESFNLEFDLGDIKTINAIEIHFPNKAWNFMPEKGKVYIGETIDDVNSDKAKADFTISKRPTTNSIVYTFKPQVARFIRISFTKGGNFDAYDEMCYAFAEVFAFGTNIKGMSVKGTKNLLEFQNKKYGIKWALVQASPNDIAPNIVRSTVTASKVTNRQKNSLKKSPYLKIVDDKKYTFKFFNAAGEEITDLGGRKVKYSFKLKGSDTAETTMVGYAGNKWYIQPLDSMGDVVKGHITAYSEDTFETNTVSLLRMTTESDPYWSNIGKLEEWGNEKPQYAPGTEAPEGFSGDTIITEDGNYYVKPLGSLTLPTDAQLVVEAITGTIPPDIYYGAATITNADNIAVSYVVSLNQYEMLYAFDGKVQMKLHIPEAVKGYFSDYSLVSIDEYGTAENVEFTRNGDYIYFETASVDNYALIGGTYHANGDAVLPETEFSGVGTSPETGDNTSAVWFMIALISLCMVVMLNMKALRKDQ